MINRDFWFGAEVEGRLSGISSMFVRYRFPNKKEQEKFNTKKIPHIYLTIEFVEENKQDSLAWDIVRDLLFCDKKMITVETSNGSFNNIPADIFNASHIIYRVSAPLMNRLKKLDTVTLDVRPYNIYYTMKDSLTHVEPDAYSGDFDTI